LFGKVSVTAAFSWNGPIGAWIIGMGRIAGKEHAIMARALGAPKSSS
jgi:hypothetical protein